MRQKQKLALVRELSAPEGTVSPGSPSPELASIVGVDKDRRVLVKLAGREDSVAALFATHLDVSKLRRAVADRADVLLLFAGGDRSRPVIVGLTEQHLDATPDAAGVAVADARAAFAVDAKVDGQRVRIVAEDELVLECGKASVTLRRNGRLVAKGTHVEIESEGVHRIKGAHVRIN